MSSQPENCQLEKWFERLNAPLRRLPAEEYTQLQQEVWQHIDALRAENEALGATREEALKQALAQFGDPAKFGRKMQREMMTLPRDPNLWDKNHLVAASTYAFVHITGILAAATILMLSATGLSTLIAPGLPLGDPWSVGLRYSYFVSIAAAPIWTGWNMNRTFKHDGLKGTFFGLLGVAGPAAVVSLYHHDFTFTTMALGWEGAGCISWWIASNLRGFRSGALNSIAIK